MEEIFDELVCSEIYNHLNCIDYEKATGEKRENACDCTCNDAAEK